MELFVVDDGWFAGREHDRAGLGDWYVDRKKFPQGLKSLTEAVRGLGMRFGLWIEPEMVNPESRLYRLHPGWIYRYQTREVLMGRNQYILDMSRQEVREYLADSCRRVEIPLAPPFPGCAVADKYAAGKASESGV